MLPLFKIVYQTTTRVFSCARSEKVGAEIFLVEKEKLPISLHLTLRYHFRIHGSRKKSRQRLALPPLVIRSVPVRSVGNTPPFHAMNRFFPLKLHGSPATGILKPKCQCHWAKSLSNQFVKTSSEKVTLES